MLKKNRLSVLLALILALGFSSTAFAAEIPFVDVPADAWYYQDVNNAYSMALINGRDGLHFDPDANLTYGEAVKLATCMNQKAVLGDVQALGSGSPWYQPYADYCRDQGIISKEYPWNEAATRAGYVEIFAHALPEASFQARNEIPDGAIPDVSMDHPQAAEIYLLYRAGILTGGTVSGDFNPDSSIRRCEVAAILTRMMDEDARKDLSLGTPVPEEGQGAEPVPTQGEPGNGDLISGEGGSEIPAQAESPQEGTNEAVPEEDSQAGTAVDYTDVPEDAWYREDVTRVSEAGLMDGIGPGLFGPEVALTRAMLAQILFNACGAESDTGARSTYTDVPEDAWYHNAVGWAGSAGLIPGHENEAFEPETLVTRQDLAFTLWRLAWYQGRDTENMEDVRLLRFPDVWELEPYAETAVKWVCGSGIMQGEADGCFNPSGSTTRAQLATVLARYADPSRALPWTQPHRVVVLDPGHGKSAFLMSDEEKTAAGWVQNESGVWGDWAHYAVGSGSQPCFGQYCSHEPEEPDDCFFQMAKSDRKTEQELTLANALAAKQYLEQAGYEVRLTRTTNDENPSFTRRLSYCFPDNDNSLVPDADAFVCIHSNAGGARGSAYVALSGTYDQAWIPADYAEKGNRLGQLCNAAIVKNSSLKQWSDGAITFMPDLIIFRKAPTICAYLEIGFYDAPSDLAILRSESDRIGFGIAQGIHTFLLSEAASSAAS